MNGNFGLLLARRCSGRSRLIDAVAGTETGVGEGIARWAGFFSARGLRAGDRLVLGCSLSVRTLTAYLGALYAGLETATVDNARLLPAADFLADLSGIKALWSEDARVRDAARLRGVPVLEGDPDACLAPVEAGWRGDDEIALLVATSGSLGMPKFVMVSQANLAANTAAIARSQQLLEGGDECAMLILPVAYCFGASVLHTHLYCGGSVVVDGRFMFPDRVLAAMARWGCTSFAGVPSVYKLLLRRSSFGKIAIPALVRLLQAGGPLDTGSIAAVRAKMPGVAFYVMYGQTEATARISCLDPERIETKVGSVGRPLDNLVVEVRDPLGNRLGPGTRGRIWVQGPSVCQGYLDDPGATGEVFVDGWLDTRDVGMLDFDGFLWLDGRSEEFLKVRGVRLAFGEIEARVRGVAGVADAAVVAVPHVEAGEVPVVFVVSLPGPVPGVVEAVRALLPPAWSCERVVALPSLPLNDRGKVDRKHLRNLALEAEPLDAD
ncbi:MAG: AMP-binding protein [Magnetococcales bacterium]|nr:AMP-binding protein [Magnetococcales bacterium]